MLTKDYRGMLLCEACWNGVHFAHTEQPRRVICKCLDSRCQCPCSKMELAHKEHLQVLREFRKANLAAQIQIPDVGAGYSHVNPQDRKPDGRN